MTGARALQLFAVGMMLAALTMSGCSDDEASGGDGQPAVCKVCTAGATQCAGSVSLTCDDEGRSFSASPCLVNQYCDLGSGACEDSLCPSPLHRACKLGGLERCKGGALVTEACGSDEACKGGACVKAACTDGATDCGFGVVLTCAGGQWTEGEVCGAGQRCRTTADGAACASQACAPRTPICVDVDGDGTFESAYVCGDDGSGPDESTKIDCAAKGGVCNGGACACVDAPPAGADASGDTMVSDAATGEPDVSDASDGGGSDGIVVHKDVPPLEKPDKAKAVVNGEEIEFDSLGKASWQATAGEDGVPGEFGILQLQFAAGVRLIEVQIAPVRVGWTGSINSDAGGDIVGFIGYSDGTSPAEVDFTFGAGVYTKGEYPGSWDITVDENTGYDGRVTGSFYGTLSRYDGAGTAEVLDGTFDVHHD